MWLRRKSARGVQKLVLIARLADVRRRFLGRRGEKRRVWRAQRSRASRRRAACLLKQTAKIARAESLRKTHRLIAASAARRQHEPDGRRTKRMRVGKAENFVD